MTVPEGERGLPNALAGVSALAVVAHPDDESFGLGAVLSAMAASGAMVRVLCLTAGEASTLGATFDLAAVRRTELADAAEQLGLSDVHLDDFADGGLATVAEESLDQAIDRRLDHATVLVTFELEGVTGHPDHRAASAAAARVAARRGLLLAEWGIAPLVATRLRRELGVPFSGLEGPGVIEFVVDRSRQLGAIARHVSQATGNAVLARRLELQGDAERLRLRHPRSRRLGLLSELPRSHEIQGSPHGAQQLHSP